MKIYFSGGTGLDAVPESLIPKRKPRIMLTFYDIRKTGTKKRFLSFLHGGTAKTPPKKIRKQ